MKTKIIDSNYATGSSYSNINDHKNESGEIIYKTGSCNSVQGIVLIYQEGYPEKGRSKTRKFLSLTTIINGRSYHRTIYGKVYTNIGIARKAGEFIRELKNNWLNAIKNN